ncbi:hypothetical protein KCP70_11725 [Salmonella enterica subsp. enterica]|nr:hypothetical protein KCP70_11725 [Salmonella enterica subsp. enterica]
MHTWRNEAGRCAIAVFGPLWTLGGDNGGSVLAIVSSLRWTTMPPQSRPG